MQSNLGIYPMILRTGDVHSICSKPGSVIWKMALRPVVRMIHPSCISVTARNWLRWNFSINLPPERTLECGSYSYVLFLVLIVMAKCFLLAIYAN